MRTRERKVIGFSANKRGSAKAAVQRKHARRQGGGEGRPGVRKAGHHHRQSSRLSWAYVTMMPTSAQTTAKQMSITTLKPAKLKIWPSQTLSRRKWYSTKTTANGSRPPARRKKSASLVGRAKHMGSERCRTEVGRDLSEKAN